MNKLRIGVLGGANIATRSIIPAIQELSEKFILAGIASRNSDKAQKIASDFGMNAYTGYNEIIDKSIIDALYIPLPNSMHFEWAKKALENNIHVLVEKSLGCNLEEVTELTKIAQGNNLAILENFQFRFHTQLDYIQTLIKENKIGELRCIRTSFGFPPFPDTENIRYKKELGGGALLDAGAYPMKISKLLLGNNIFVSAAKAIIPENMEVDIWGGGMIEQKNGNLFSEFAFGFDHQYQCNLELWGSKGKLTTNRIFTAPPGYSPEILLEIGKEKETITLEPCNHFKNMLEHFHNACFSKEIKEQEYNDNLVQARLLQEFKTISNAK